MEDYSSWTSCEFYGHQFVTDEETQRRYCTDCDENAED